MFSKITNEDSFYTKNGDDKFEVNQEYKQYISIMSNKKIY